MHFLRKKPACWAKGVALLVQSNKTVAHKSLSMKDKVFPDETVLGFRPPQTRENVSWIQPRCVNNSAAVYSCRHRVAVSRSDLIWLHICNLPILLYNRSYSWTRAERLCFSIKTHQHVSKGTAKTFSGIWTHHCRVAAAFAPQPQKRPPLFSSSLLPSCG